MNYAKAVIIKAKQENAFLAVSQEVDKWWGKVDNAVSKIGDEFSIIFGETEWRFRITEYSKYEKISWKCIKANHYHNGSDFIKEEWLNTEIYWNFRLVDLATEISFLHKGLKPELICYEICESGWDFFITTSLKNYLETGLGKPHFE